MTPRFYTTLTLLQAADPAACSLPPSCAVPRSALLRPALAHVLRTVDDSVLEDDVDMPCCLRRQRRRLSEGDGTMLPVVGTVSTGARSPQRLLDALRHEALSPQPSPMSRAFAAAYNLAAANVSDLRSKPALILQSQHVQLRGPVNSFSLFLPSFQHFLERSSEAGVPKHPSTPPPCAQVYTARRV